MRLIDNRLTGFVDRVPGRFCVATEFLTLCGFPIKPLGSWVVSDGDRPPRSVTAADWVVPIPTCRRSVFFAYTWHFFHLTHIWSLVSTVVGMAAMLLRIRAGAVNQAAVPLAATFVWSAISFVAALWLVRLSVARPTAERLNALRQAAWRMAA